MIPDSINPQDLTDLLEDNKFDRLVDDLASSEDPAVTKELAKKLASQVKYYRKITRNLLLDSPKQTFEVKAPEEPFDLVFDCLYHYFSNLPEQEQIVYKNHTCAEMVIEFANKSPLATEYWQYLFDALISQPDFLLKKAEAWDASKHTRLTEVALSPKKPSPYMLIKTLFFQFNRVAMLGYLENKNALTYVRDVEDLKTLAKAFLDSLD